MADVICRWRNSTPQTVAELANALPHIEMDSESFHKHMSKSIYGDDFFRTPYQLACQLGLYYDDGLLFHPRFNHDITEEEANIYLRKWLHRYYAPNPYTKSLKALPTPILVLKSIVEALERNGEQDLRSLLENLFKDPMGNIDIIKNLLNNYSNVVRVSQEDIISLQDNYKEYMSNINRNDKESFFHSFDDHPNEHHIEITITNIIPYLSAIRTKPFVLLAGISGTGKSRIVRKLAQATTTPELQKYSGKNFEDIRWTIHNPENFALIQVKPNWHNSMDVVGYLSEIPEKHYVFTPFVRFIAKAWLHPDVPFFLCLDEMNLAPVEEYFAEYLSAIESRSKEGDIYKTDPIVEPFKNLGGNRLVNEMKNDLFNNDKDDKEEYGNKYQEIRGAAKDNVLYGSPKKVADAFEESGITLPENLIVVGTVNMDETTFSFSRKVLDRAMSIEMNEVDFDAFVEGETEYDIPALDKETSKLLINRPVKGIEVKDGIDADKVISYLKQINELLDGTQFKLGYRAANEALLYVSAAQDFGLTDINAALDDFTLMKILSRIEGDETKLRKAGKDGNILEELAKIVKDCLAKPAEEMNTEEEATEETEKKDPEEKEKRELKSVEKIKMMMGQLERDHFVSYWN